MKSSESGLKVLNFMPKSPLEMSRLQKQSGQLAHFLANAASVKTGQSLSWLSSCQDLLFTVSSEPEFENYIFLRIYIGSNSNDECDWRVNADLLLRPEQLYHFALAVPLPQR